MSFFCHSKPVSAVRVLLALSVAGEATTTDALEKPADEGVGGKQLHSVKRIRHVYFLIDHKYKACQEHRAPDQAMDSPRLLIQGLSFRIQGHNYFSCCLLS